jgi:hypothetical protein
MNGRIREASESPCGETLYERDPRGIKPGIRVTVWYRSVGERRPVADKVSVIPDATH